MVSTGHVSSTAAQAAEGRTATPSAFPHSRGTQPLPSTSIEPGDTVLTRMPCGTNSSAQRSVSKISAALAAPYWPDIASCGDQPEIEATLITPAR